MTAEEKIEAIKRIIDEDKDIWTIPCTNTAANCKGNMYPAKTTDDKFVWHCILCKHIEVF